MTLYWDSLLEVIPDLKKEPPKMRVHEEKSKDGQDHLLFWPIGQELLAHLARRLLNRASLGKKPSKAAVKTALQPLAKGDWEMHNAPWRYLLLTTAPGGTWKIRSEDRKPAQACAQKILMWVLGVADYSTEEISALEEEWAALLIPQPKPEEAHAMWENIEKMRRSRVSK